MSHEALQLQWSVHWENVWLYRAGSVWEQDSLCVCGCWLVTFLFYLSFNCSSVLRVKRYFVFFLRCGFGATFMVQGNGVRVRALRVFTAVWVETVWWWKLHEASDGANKHTYLLVHQRVRDKQQLLLLLFMLRRQITRENYIHWRKLKCVEAFGVSSRL